MASRPLELGEYREIIRLLNNGFITENNTVFRPNKQVALILQLEASLGLRVGDVLSLRVNNFRDGKLEIHEEKTGKLQYRDINRGVYDFVRDYAIENQLPPTAKIFNVGVRAVQDRLKTVTDYLNLENITTHSFRKMYAQETWDQYRREAYSWDEALRYVNRQLGHGDERNKTLLAVYVKNMW